MNALLELSLTKEEWSIPTEWLENLFEIVGYLTILTEKKKNQVLEILHSMSVAKKKLSTQTYSFVFQGKE